jgi:hypothetical protein
VETGSSAFARAPIMATESAPAASIPGAVSGVIPPIATMGLARLADFVGRDSDDEVRGDLPGHTDGEIGLSEMNACGTRDQSDVDPVVDEHFALPLVAERDRDSCQFGKGAGVEGLGPELHPGCSRLEEGRGEVPGLAHVPDRDIHDGVERRGREMGHRR